MSAVGRARRRQLDRHFATLGESGMPAPQRGWVHTMRTSLGLTVRQLALRMSRSPSTVSQLEAAESSGAVTLARLRAAADALDCELVYALVPRAGSIEATLDRRAELTALRLMEQAGTHMRLEDQEVEVSRAKARLAELAAELRRLESRLLWDDG
ncbi:MAG: mobile mystery protein A [bacterium]|nr:mobile mystery protein A [bacterium]